MTEIAINKLSLERLTAAIELLNYLTINDKSHMLNLQEINSVLIVAGVSPIEPEKKKEVEVMNV